LIFLQVNSNSNDENCLQLVYTSYELTLKRVNFINKLTITNEKEIKKNSHKHESRNFPHFCENNDYYYINKSKITHSLTYIFNDILYKSCREITITQIIFSDNELVFLLIIHFLV
jgi:hypothetical protein